MAKQTPPRDRGYQSVVDTLRQSQKELADRRWLDFDAFLAGLERRVAAAEVALGSETIAVATSDDRDHSGSR